MNSLRRIIVTTTLVTLPYVLNTDRLGKPSKPLGKVLPAHAGIGNNLPDTTTATKQQLTITVILQLSTNVKTHLENYVNIWHPYVMV